MTPPRAREALAALGVVAVACAAPWPFASVEPFWWSLACCAALTIAALAFLRGGDAVDLGAGPPREAWGAALLALLATGVSVLPLPGSLVAILSPATDAALARAGVTAGTGWRTLSLFPPAGVDALVVVGACVATAWLVAAASADPRARRWLSHAFLVAGVLIAAFGLAQRLIDPDPQRMFWSIEIYEVGTPFGPYVNRNHFGGAMLLFTGVAAGRAIAARAAGRRLETALTSCAAFLTALALAGTASRGALLGLAVLVAVLLVAVRGRGRARLGVAIALAGVALAAGLAATGLLDELVGRLFHVYGRWRNRFLVQADALRVLRDFPLFGTGAGTFPWVYHSFQQVDDARHFSDAHSDWVQILMECGALGLVAVVAVARALIGAGLRGLRCTLPSRWHALGALAGCAGLATHGLFETNLHIPANALLASVAVGLGYGASPGLARDVAPAGDGSSRGGES